MIWKASMIVCILVTAGKLVASDREHKVHNIVLYPDRQSWCQTTAIKQVIAMSGYEPVTIDNNVCVGACYSYSIPRTEPAEPGELIGPYCDSCQPLDTKCYHVTLQADNQNTNGARTIQKRVQIITNCSCTTCGKLQTGDCEMADKNTSELPMNLFELLNRHQRPNNSETTPKPETDVPELLNLTPPNNRSLSSPQRMNATTNDQRFEINAKLIALLKSIQNEEEDEDDEEESNLNYDREQLKELLAIIEGSEHKLSDKNLMEFVNFVNVHNSEDLELDLSRLKEVLENFQREQLSLKKHRDYGLGIDLDAIGSSNNADINRDLENLGTKYSIPKSYGVEGSRLGMGHLKGSHIGMGIQHDLESNIIDATMKAPTEEISLVDLKKSESILGSVGHHHSGEAQQLGLHEMGHLINGPHGSLVLVPDTIEEKLNLDSEEVRPNHEGIVVSYENHQHRHNTNANNNNPKPILQSSEPEF